MPAGSSSKAADGGLLEALDVDDVGRRGAAGEGDRRDRGRGLRGTAHPSSLSDPRTGRVSGAGGGLAHGGQQRLPLVQGRPGPAAAGARARSRRRRSPASRRAAPARRRGPRSVSTRSSTGPPTCSVPSAASASRRGHRLAGVVLVGADDAGRPALDPAGHVLAAGGPRRRAAPGPPRAGTVPVRSSTGRPGQRGARGSRPSGPPGRRGSTSISPVPDGPAVGVDRRPLHLDRRSPGPRRAAAPAG